jgi:rSAM/selenodomain-associated transferase 1
MPDAIRNAVILFARQPVSGKVKTRLQPALGEAKTLGLYECFLQDSLALLTSLKNVDCFVGCHPAEGETYFKQLDSAQSVRVFPQEGADLGEKMKRAFSDRFEEGYDHVVIIGSDSPSLPNTYIENALCSSKDLVLGPSADGGYYLIAMHRKVVDVFKGVSWGTETVLKETCDRIAHLGASLELLPPWYDVDRPEDLAFLETHLDLMAHAGMTQATASYEYLKQMKVKPS